MGPIRFSPENREVTTRCGDVGRGREKDGKSGERGVGVNEEGGRERGGGQSARDGMGKGKVAIGDWFLLARFTAIKGDLLDWMIRAIDTAFPFPNEFDQGA